MSGGGLPGGFLPALWPRRGEHPCLCGFRELRGAKGRGSREASWCFLFHGEGMTAATGPSSESRPLLLEHHLLCEPLPEAGGVAEPRGHCSSPAAREGAGLRRLGPHLLTERG